jgi:hypothetical protein
MAALEFEGLCPSLRMAIHFSDKSDVDRERQKQCPQTGAYLRSESTFEDSQKYAQKASLA